MNTSHTFLKKAMTNSDHRTYKNTAYIRINMLYFYILYKRGHYYIIETLYSHFSWAMTAGDRNFILRDDNRTPQLAVFKKYQRS